MSVIASAKAEKRIQAFVLKPLSLAYILAAVVTLYQHAWLLAGVFILLVIYIGWIGASLGIHRGKSFTELSQGITPSIPSLSIDKTAEDLSYDETRDLVRPMTHVLYAVILTVITILIYVGMKIYWALLIGLGVWLVGQPVMAVFVAIICTWRTR